MVVVAACFPGLSSAAPPAAQVKQPPQPTGTLGPAGPGQPAPDIAVNGVWIATVPGNNVWTRIPPNGKVKVGEALMLGCDIGVAGIVPAKSFSVAWYLDGVKTCGEPFAGLHNPPLCEFEWPVARGGTTDIVSSVSTSGAHTFTCGVVDVKVSERTRDNNSAEFHFSAYGAKSFRPVEVRLPPSPPGLLHP
jgi:hypothetical protein